MRGRRCSIGSERSSACLSDRIAFTAMPISRPSQQRIPAIATWTDFGRSSKTPPNRCRASSVTSMDSMQSISLLSRRSPPTRGSTGVCCSSAMRHMRPRPTWPKVRRWHWRMRWCWRTCSPRTARRPRPCQRSVDGGVLVSVGCGAERTAEIAYGLCPDPFATWRFVFSARPSIGETIDRCSKSHDRGDVKDLDRFGSAQVVPLGRSSIRSGVSHCRILVPMSERFGSPTPHSAIVSCRSASARPAKSGLTTLPAGRMVATLRASRENGNDQCRGGAANSRSARASIRRHLGAGSNLHRPAPFPRPHLGTLRSRSGRYCERISRSPAAAGAAAPHQLETSVGNPSLERVIPATRRKQWP
jgi:hypothetical protein